MIKDEVTKFTDNKTDYPFSAYVTPNYLSKDGEIYNIADRLDSISDKISDYEDKVNDYKITEIYIKNVRLQKEDGTVEKLNNYDLYVTNSYDNKVWKVEYTPGEYYYGYGAKCIPNKLIADVKIKNAVDEFEELNAEMTCFGNEVAPDFIRDKHNWQLKFKSEYRFGDVPKTDEIRLFADADDRNHIRAKFGSVAWEDLIKTDSNIDVLKDNNYDSLPVSFKKNKIQGCYKADIVKVYINQSETEYVVNAEYQGLYSLLNQTNEKMYGFNAADGAAIETYWPFTFSTNGSALDTALTGFTGTRTAMESKSRECYMGYRYGNLDKYRPRGWDLRGPWIHMNDQPLGTYDTEGFRWQAGEQTDDKIQSFNDMIEVINDTSVSGMTWVNLLNEKLDVKSVIDYYLFNNVYFQTIANYRNMYLWNDDCSTGKWHIGGGNTHYFWNTTAFTTNNREIHSDMWFYGNSENILFERLWNETTLISDRYKELRNNGVFTSGHAYELMTNLNYSQWYYQSTFDQNTATSGCMFDGSHTVSDPNGVSADILLTNRTNQLGVSSDNVYNVSSNEYKNYNTRLTRLDTFLENGTTAHKHWLMSKVTPKSANMEIDPENPVINLFDYFDVEPKQFNSTENEFFGCSFGCVAYPYASNGGYAVGANGTNVTTDFKGLYGPSWIEKNEDGTEYKYMLDTTKLNVSAFGNSSANNGNAARMTNWEHKFYPNTELTGTTINGINNNLVKCDSPWPYPFTVTDTSPVGRVKNVIPTMITIPNEIPSMIKDVEIKKSLNKFEINGFTNAPKFYGDVKAKIEVNDVDVTDEFKNIKNEYVIPERFTSDTEFKITPVIDGVKYPIVDEDYNSESTLPTGYKKLSYIENNNTSNWINTEITLLANDKVETRIDYTKIYTDTYYALFGAKNEANNKEYTIYLKNNNGASYARQETLYWSGIQTGKQIIRTDNTGAKFYDFDENLLGEITLTKTPLDCERQCYIFAYNNNNTAGTGGASNYTKFVKMYYFKVFDETDNLKAHLIPAIEESTNKIGMYDIVNNKFLENRATTVFDYAVIDNEDNKIHFEGTPEYVTMKYIPNVGIPLRCIGAGWGAYVDTGIEPSQLVNGYIDCSTQRDNDPYDGWIYGVGTTRNDDYTVAYGYSLNFRRNAQTISVRGALASTVGAAFAYASHNDDKYGIIRTEHYCNKECILTNKHNGFTTRAYRNFICTPEQMEAGNTKTMYLYAFNGNTFDGKKVLTYIYDFTAKDSNGDTLIQLTPVLKDGVPTFYDIISNTYYPLNLDEFDVNGMITYKTYDSDEVIVYNAKLNIPDEDSEIIDLDYIGTIMNSRNRVDTGINPYDVSKIKAKFKYSAKVNYSVICGARSKERYDIFELSVDDAGKISLYDNRERALVANKLTGNTVLNMNQMYEVNADFDTFNAEVTDLPMTYGLGNNKWFVTKYSKNNTLWLFNDNSSLDHSYYNGAGNVCIAYIEITTKDGVEHKLYPKLYNGIPVFYDLDTKEKHAVQTDNTDKITQWFYSVNGSEVKYKPI